MTVADESKFCIGTESGPGVGPLGGNEVIPCFNTPTKSKEIGGVTRWACDRHEDRFALYEEIESLKTPWGRFKRRLRQNVREWGNPGVMLEAGSLFGLPASLRSCR